MVVYVCLERVILTLQQILYKQMEFHQSLKWTKFLPEAINIYMNRRHRSIEMSPLNAELASSQKDLEKIHNKKYSKVKRQKPKYQIGDPVRIAVIRGKFKRGYHKNFSDEVFIVDKVKINLPIPRYSLKDLRGEDIIGNFFPNEIVKVYVK